MKVIHFTYYYFFLQNDELLSDIDLISVLDTQPKLDGYPTDCVSSTTQVILLLCSSKHTKYQRRCISLLFFKVIL